jgi:hypothetical protein
MKNFEQTVISQYANSPTLMRLIRCMNEAISADVDIENFYNYCWNVETAVGVFLDNWGRIVGISRNLQLPVQSSYFGFQDGLSDYYGFGQEPFYSGTIPATQTYALSDDAYRTIIMAKALFNITAANTPSINQLLLYLFPGTRSYASSQGNMQMQFTFEFVLSALQFAIVTQSGVIPIPAGVDATMLSSVLPVFGFSEAGEYSAAPFGSAPFISPEAINAVI